MDEVVGCRPKVRVEGKILGGFVWRAGGLRYFWAALMAMFPKTANQKPAMRLYFVVFGSAVVGGK